jgi:pyrroline-5-carboxylate reductase
MKIGIIGLGNMGGSIYRSIKDKYEVLPFDPYRSAWDKKIVYVTNLDELVDASDYIILAVKPSTIPAVLDSIRKPQNYISIAAGVTIETIRKHTLPGSKVSRVMPNLPLVVQSGCSCFIGDSEQDDVVREVFSHCGEVVQISDEKLMDAVTGLSGSGPAFVFSFIQAMAEGGVKAGLSYTDALRLSILTVKGSAEYLEKQATHPMEQRNKVTSPGGTTIYGLSELEKNRFSYSVMEAVFQAALRSKELSG